MFASLLEFLHGGVEGDHLLGAEKGRMGGKDKWFFEADRDIKRKSQILSEWALGQMLWGMKGIDSI